MITAESLVVEIAAKVDKARSDIKGVDRDFATAANGVQGATKRIEAAVDRATATIERDAARIGNAQRNIGRQFADIGAQAASGQSPFLIFAQQAPQLADALTDTGGKAARVAAFFSGPWGAAILAAGSILGTTLIPRLLEGGDAAETMTAAQMDLARFVDVTTGAINRQTTAVERLAAAQARQTELERKTETYRSSRGAAINAVREASGQRAPVFTAGGVTLQRGAADDVQKRLRQLVAEVSAGKRSISDFGVAVRQAVGDRPEYRDLVKTVTAQAAASTDAVRSVARLRAEQALLTGTATAQQKALLGVGQATTGLIEKQVALATATSASERARARLALVEERGRGIQAGDTKALGQYRADLTAAQNAVKSAEAAERGATAAKREHAKATREAARAERERLKDLRGAARNERDLLGLNADLLSSKGDLTSDSRLQDEFQRQRIRIDQQGQTSRLDEQRALGDLTQQEYDERRKLIDAITENRLRLVNRNESIRAANEDLAAAQARIGNERELLDAQASVARTSRERAAIQNQLLDLAIEERRLVAQRVVDLAAQGKASAEEGAIAQATLNSLQAVQAAGRRTIAQQTMSPGGSYLSSLPGTADEINEAVESIEARGLEKLNSELTDAILGAKSLGDVFGNVADQIIADLLRIAIQQAVIKPIAESLFGGASGLGGGGEGTGIAAVLGLASKIFGRSSGGYVGPGQTVRVNEHRGGVELLRMGSGQGATVMSLGEANAAQARRPAAAPTVVQLVVGKGQMFEPAVRSISGNVAVQVMQAGAPQIVSAATAQARREAPGTIERYQRLGSVR